MPAPTQLSDWPQASDLTPKFVALGLSGTASADLWTPIKRAVAWFQKETGYLPFLGKQQVRYFDPPGGASGFIGRPMGGGRKIFLDNGLLSINSVAIGGSVKINGTDYWLRPNNNDAKGLPFEWIEFLVPIYGSAQSIAIDGVWGRMVYPDYEVWQGVLDYAAVLAAPEIISLKTKGFIRWTDGDTSEEYGQSPLEKQIELWTKSALAAVENNKRRTVGL